MQQVLIFAPTGDAHAGAIAWALEASGVEALWTPSTRLGAQARGSLMADADGIRAHSNACDLSRIGAVWHRAPELPGAAATMPEDREFAARQWQGFQSNALALEQSFVDALWVNRPAAAEAAENKWVQLRAAHAVGLRFPEAIASNDAAEVRALLRRCGRLVFKQFHTYMWQSRSSGELRSSDVVLLDAQSELPEAAIAVCPGIYQRYIDKAYDVRVSVIGDRLFPVRLLRRGGGAYVDWRPHIRDEDLLAEPIELPVAVEARLRALMARLDLVLGCIDLVVDHAGEMYFLEVNQQGQFLFVEELLPQLPLLRAMTSMLASGRRDYALDAVADVRFATYVRSERYRHLLAAPRAANPALVYES